VNPKSNGAFSVNVVLQKIPRTFRLLALVLAAQLLFFSLLRILFWAYFNSPDDPLASSEILQAFYIGLKFDLRVILLLNLPLLLLSWWRPLGYFSASGRRLFLIYQSLAFALLLLVQMFQFGYYAYLKQPLDATIFRFAENAALSLQMVWQTYPVLWLSLLLAALVGLHAYFLRTAHSRVAVVSVAPRNRKQGFAIVSLLGFLVLFAIYGKLSHYPLRWSDAYFSTHPFTAAIAVNPAYQLLETYKNKDDSFDRQVLFDNYPLLVDYLGIDQPDAEHLNFTRPRETHAPLAAKRPNIVMVFLESFASYKSSVSGNPLRPTPAIEQLAQQGLYFDNYFVPHTGTARSVFTAITGFPDIEVNDTSTRNPLIVRQHSIISDFKDYQYLYFLGGSASWGNIRGLLSASISGLQIFEEGSYKAPDVDVWGVSDIDLFDEANQILAAKSVEKPFVAIIQTSGNHRPYTIPENNHGFKLTDYSDAEVKKHGFESKTEYESFRFMDHSVGFFIEQAKKSAYFANTIFVFFGDHGISASTGDHVSSSEQQLGLQSLRVPLIMYAPQLIAPRVDHRIVSEVDLLPSIAGLAAERFTNTALGRNVFDPRFDQSRVAITVEHHSDLTLGLLDGEFYYRKRLAVDQEQFYKINNANPREDVAAQYPEQQAKFKQLLDVLYQFVKYQRHHNPPLTDGKLAARAAD